MQALHAEYETFVVNFDDPDDVRAKMRFAEQKADDADARLAEIEKLRRDSERWRTRAKFLASQLDEPAADDALADSDASSTVALAVGVVNREQRKIRARDVHATLVSEGHTMPRSAVANSLYYAAHRARSIQAAEGRGMYAPIGFREPTLHDSTNGAAPEL
jgi:hypothetical protein